MSKTKVEIIYENADIVIVNKPAGVSVTKDREGGDDILGLLQKQFGVDEKLKLVHRLDKFTSGVMLLAKNTSAQSQYSSFFAKRKVEKTYLALVQGPLPALRGRISSPLSRSRKDPKKMVVDPRRGKEAVTDWEVIADFGSICLVAVRPLTGRTHQIRVHFSSIGSPLSIDPLYGGEDKLLLSRFKIGYRLARGKTESPLIERLSLHAYELIVPGSDLGDSMRFIAPLDRKFKAAVKMLTKHSAGGQGAFIKGDNFAHILESNPLL